MKGQVIRRVVFYSLVYGSAALIIALGFLFDWWTVIFR